VLKQLKRAGSEVVEATLEKDVEMKMRVKHVVTIANSMIHITVQLTTRAGSCEDQKFESSGCPG